MSLPRLTAFFVACFFLFVFIDSMALAQTGVIQGGVSGSVTGTTGSRIPGARVTLFSQDRSTTRNTVTTADGADSVAPLASGSWRFDGSVPGFRIDENSEIVIAIGRNTPIDVRLASVQASSKTNGAAQTSASQLSTAASQNAQQQPSTLDTRHAEADRELKQEEQQRMLGVVPDFYSVRSGRAAPLSPGQKFRLALADVFDPFDVSASAAEAGLEQRQGEFPEYGTGWTGFAKRFGAAYADDADGELLSEGVFPSLLHQDPRYFRLGQGTITHRIGYSLFSAVRCRGDNGKWQFNTSGIAGTFAAGALSNAYYPPADRGLGLTLQRGSIDIGEGLLQSFASEFYPDIVRALSHRRPKQASPPAP